MAGRYSSNCLYFEWKYVNYNPSIHLDNYYSGGNHQYIPNCRLPQMKNFIWRPTLYPCDGCPYYEEGQDWGPEPPN